MTLEEIIATPPLHDSVRPDPDQGILKRMAAEEGAWSDLGDILDEYPIIG